jgi:hypothetical protein
MTAVPAFAGLPLGVLIRSALCLCGVLNLALAAGYFFQLPWALATWPWPDAYGSGLSNAFVAAMLASIGAAVMWIGASGEFEAMPAGALNLVVMLGGITALLLRLATDPGQQHLLSYAAVCGALAVGNLALFLWLVRVPIRQHLRPKALPVLVRASFVAFSVVVVAVGLALLLGVPDVLPWPTRPETAAVYGWVFFGDAWYFLYAVARPVWVCARAQLWSFLVYDAVLLGPLISHLGTVPDDLLPSLLAYLGVVLYSAGLAAYYLFLDKRARIWEAV